MFATGRNATGLTERQVEYCREAWSILCGGRPVEFDCSTAHKNSSKTRFNEDQKKVYLGADAYPGDGADANSRMSTLACLAHELAHADRFKAGYQRPIQLPDVLVDKAETSLRASFASVLRIKDRKDLVEDARDRLIYWLSIRQQRGANDES